MEQRNNRKKINETKCFFFEKTNKLANVTLTTLGHTMENICLTNGTWKIVYSHEKE